MRPATLAANVPDSVEECLKQGLVHRAQELGWWGDESAYLLVRDGGSHNFHVTLPKKRAVVADGVVGWAG